MSAPANDNFANAASISGSSGNTTGTNVSATTESGEPGRLAYNPGPSLPVANFGIAATHTVWWVWTCPASGDYFFSTRDQSGLNRTDFPSVLQVLLGTAVNAMVEATYLINASVGDGWGTDLGASVALECTSGTIYYIRVDGRAGATGSIYLSWGAYNALWLGPCTSCAVDLSGADCVGTVSVSDVTHDSAYSFGTFSAAVTGKYKVKYCSGAWYDGSHYHTFGGFICFEGLFDLLAAATFPIVNWDTTGDTGYSAGTAVIFQPPGGYTLAVATAGVPVVDPNYLHVHGISNVWWAFTGMVTSGSTVTYDPFNSYPLGTIINYLDPSYTLYGISTALMTVPNVGPPQVDGNLSAYWNRSSQYIFADHSANTAAKASRLGACAVTPLFDHSGGDIGIVWSTEWATLNGLGGINTATPPTFQLIYNPFNIDMLTNEVGFVINSGTNPNWNFQFVITNNSNIDWDNVYVELLNTGGVSSAAPSAGGDPGVIVGSAWVVTLAAGTFTGVGNFTFVADATAGLVTATIRISRNGIVLGTIDYPIYPIYATSLTRSNFLEHTCSTFKTWLFQTTSTILWPHTNSNMFKWGADTGIGCGGSNSLSILTRTLSGISGPAMYNDDVNHCTPVTSISDFICLGLSGAAGFDSKQFGPAFQASTGSTTPAVIAVGMTWQCGSTTYTLPTTTFNLTVAAA